MRVPAEARPSSSVGDRRRLCGQPLPQRRHAPGRRPRAAAPRSADRPARAAAIAARIAAQCSSPSSAPISRRSAPARHRQRGRLRDAVRGPHPGHVQGVGDHDTVEPQLAAQQVVQQPPAQRRGGGSSAANTTCEVITRSTPASTAATNGGRSRRRKVAASASMTGRPRCESTVVAPWPGKCFALAATPAALQARDERGAVPGHRLRVGPERADADDRVADVAVDVDRRREVDVRPRPAGGRGRSRRPPTGSAPRRRPCRARGCPDSGCPRGSRAG